MYPKSYKYVQFPQEFIIPEFAKYTGNDQLEHIG
jgi:hypothetical protein